MSEEKLSAKEVAMQLQQTIEQLQRLVIQLNTDTLRPLPSTITLTTLKETTDALTLSLNPVNEDVITPEPLISEELEQQTAEFSEFLEETSGTPTEPVPFTGVSDQNGLLQRLLNPIRGILPTSINESLSDGSLIGILVGILLAVLIGGFLLIYPQWRDTKVDIAESPPIIETPVELESPEPPQPILVEPPPQPEISPEQRLIQAVQEDIANITSRYPEGLIETIEAYFSENLLVVVVGDDWYQLRPSLQDDVAKGIYQKAKNLDFEKLELVNSQGEILARSPVVGNQMIILVRN